MHYNLRMLCTRVYTLTIAPIKIKLILCAKQSFFYNFVLLLKDVDKLNVDSIGSQ